MLLAGKLIATLCPSGAHVNHMGAPRDYAQPKVLAAESHRRVHTKDLVALQPTH